MLEVMKATAGDDPHCIHYWLCESTGWSTCLKCGAERHFIASFEDAPRRSIPPWEQAEINKQRREYEFIMGFSFEGVSCD